MFILGVCGLALLSNTMFTNAQLLAHGCYWPFPYTFTPSSSSFLNGCFSFFAVSSSLHTLCGGWPSGAFTTTYTSLFAKASAKESPFTPFSAQSSSNCWISSWKISCHDEADGSAITTNVVDLAAPSSAELGALENLYRENLKLSEEEQKILKEEPNDVIKNVGILTALRTASESEPPRIPANSKSRNQKRQKIDMDGAADSPGPSPIATSAAASRLKGNAVRSGSVPTMKETKEVPVKTEEGAEGSKGPSAERAGKFFVGAEVAYKQAKMKEDGSQWIQCNIIAITDIGNKKR